MTNKKDKNKLVVRDAGWADTIPEWLIEEIKTERMIYGLANVMNSDNKVIGDAETVAYLMTASLHAPMSTEYVNIYFYLTARLMKKRGIEKLPDFIQEAFDHGLTDYERQELNELRTMIYRKRGGEIDTSLLNALRKLKKEDSTKPKGAGKK